MEKEKRLRQGLNVVGVSHGAYWMSWIIFAILIELAQINIQYAISYMFNFEFWVNVPYEIMFRIFFAYNTTVVSFAFMISTIITKQDQANRISFMVILTAVLIGVMFSEPRATLGIFRNEKTQDIFFIKAVRYMFEMIPTFSFSLAFGLVCTTAARHLPFATNVWTAGRPFTLEDYNSPRIIIIKLSNDKVDCPPVAYFVFCMWRTFFISVTLFWYFDHIFASNRGVAHSLLFPF